MRKVMFVCTGNTCRSPMAEYILKDILKKAEIEDVKVTSSGLMASPDGKVTKEAIGALKKRGIVIRRFKCKKTDSDLCRKQDAVICMTREQKGYFVGFKNVYSIDELTSLGDISDPYGGTQEDYDNCAEKIYLSCEKIFELLNK